MPRVYSIGALSRSPIVEAICSYPLRADPWLRMVTSGTSAADIRVIFPPAHSSIRPHDAVRSQPLLALKLCDRFLVEPKSLSSGAQPRHSCTGRSSGPKEPYCSMGRPIVILLPAAGELLECAWR